MSSRIKLPKQSYPCCSPPFLARNDRLDIIYSPLQFFSEKLREPFKNIECDFLEQLNLHVYVQTYVMPLSTYCESYMYN